MTRVHPPQSGRARSEGDVSVLVPGSLQDRRMIVSGAGSGIGRAIALRLVELGAHVHGLGRRPDVLGETGELAAGLDGKFTFRSADLRQEIAARADQGV